MQLAALIFDVDGTLAETEELHRRAFNETFAAHGYDWHWSRDLYGRLLKVTGGKERLRVWVDDIGHAATDRDLAALHREKTERFVVLLSSGTLELRPGVARIIEEARVTGLRLAIATTTSPANVEALARSVWKRPANDVFEVIAAGDEVDHKKPAPDVYHLALRRLGLSAQAVLAFEDSSNGLRSAIAAGLRTVVTPSIYTLEDDFTRADVILPDLAAFDPFDWQATNTAADADGG